MMMMGMNPLDVFPDSIPRAKTCDVTRTHPPSEGLLFDKKLNWEDFLHWRCAIYTQPLFQICIHHTFSQNQCHVSPSQQVL